MTKRLFAANLFALCLLLTAVLSFSQQADINDILNYTLSYRGLTRNDITIPIEFFTAAEKSPTNDAKLIMPLVKDMMINPLRSETWLDSVMQIGEKNLPEIIAEMFQMAGLGDFKYEYTGSFSNRINDLLETIEEHVDNSDLKREQLLSVYSNKEMKFLNDNVFSILEDSDSDDDANTDIFKFNEARDSSIAISKRTMELLSKLDLTQITEQSSNDFSFCYALYQYAIANRELLNTYYDTHRNPNKLGVTLGDEAGRRIIIGGKGNDDYYGDYAFIIDLGGDDSYNLENRNNKSKGMKCIIDLSGNDYYTSIYNFSMAGGLFASSFIFDKGGDDVYESKKGSANLGAAIGGLGLVYDEKGSDTYRSISFSIGAGCFGVGLVVDKDKNDFYIANSYSQGFGMTQGIGAIVDSKGNDSYLIDSRSPDIGRYNDHFVSMCQGYGLGLRPYYAGGIGLIIEGEGNDVYNTDIFGQGGAYWYSLGAIADKSGHDKYNGYQYSQGAGIHLAVGLLKDYDGWDFYQSNGVSQGCGHDFGFGMLWDVKGNDNYSAYSLSQGAGNANGIGMLIDQSGVDGYLNKFPANTHGYGNQRREYGSIGVFLDASGEDYYSQPGYDSTLINSSMWGVMNDFYLRDLPEQISGDNFKVQVDSINRPHDVPFTMEQYFIMAKTIEPRFSYWQEYGFRKLISDSINTAGYMLTKLGTDDARETQVMRVLAQKMQKPAADALVTKLNAYLTDKSAMTQPEVSFACYVFGETKNSEGKEILLQLTYDDNYKIRSSAVNALGKIKYDENDNDFKNKVSHRLRTLANEQSEKKLYRKDIAFAFNNYRIPENIPVLMAMLKDPYYGARFNASDNLRQYGDVYMSFINDLSTYQVSDDYSWMNPFLYSITNLSEENFKKVYYMVKTELANKDGLMNENLIDIIRLRRGKSSEPGFLEWCNTQVEELQKESKQKIK